MRSSTQSPLDSTGSATESTTSSAVNEEESNYAISNVVSTKELDDKDLDESNVMLNDPSTEDVTKKMGAIDASSTNEDDDSGKIYVKQLFFSSVFQARFIEKIHITVRILKP